MGLLEEGRGGELISLKLIDVDIRGCPVFIWLVVLLSLCSGIFSFSPQGSILMGMERDRCVRGRLCWLEVSEMGVLGERRKEELASLILIDADIRGCPVFFWIVVLPFRCLGTSSFFLQGSSLIGTLPTERD